MEAKALRGAAVLLFWVAAALLVLVAHQLLDPISGAAAATVKVAVIVAVAFAYMRLTARQGTLDHALAVGVAWLLFDVIAELMTAKAIGRGWFELIGSPSSPWLRNLLMIAWIGAPAVFSRSERADDTVAQDGERRVVAAPPASVTGMSDNVTIFVSAFFLLFAVAARAQETPRKPAAPEPFAFADFSWVPGNYSAPDHPLSTKDFTGELRVDTVYHYDFNRPQDDTISGSSEVFRHNEFQLTQLGIGGDFNHDHIQARLMTQFGMYSFTTPRNDASPGRGQWSLDGGYRYVSEAYGGYHIDKWSGINIQAGIFMSYVGLWSYYNFDNWTYQPSYVSSNTPWFFNGMRVQIFPNDKLKIEPWLVNGWQSYGKFNTMPGIGMQVLYRPNGRFSILGNQYYGTDTLGNADRRRFHTDDSAMMKYHDAPDSFISKAAASLTVDAGCETGGGTKCSGGNAGAPSQYFLGFMLYNRLWFAHDRYALTVGGGAINNPGRYLVLLPPINGATAFSGTPYFTENPGDKFRAWDTQVTFDYIPKPYVVFRSEFNHRAANVPYFSGRGGVTPPGGNTGAAGSVVPGWSPDLRKSENRISFAMMVKL